MVPLDPVEELVEPNADPRGLTTERLPRSEMVKQTARKVERVNLSPHAIGYRAVVAEQYPQLGATERKHRDKLEVRFEPVLAGFGIVVIAKHRRYSGVDDHDRDAAIHARQTPDRRRSKRVESDLGDRARSVRRGNIGEAQLAPLTTRRFVGVFSQIRPFEAIPPFLAEPLAGFTNARHDSGARSSPTSSSSRNTPTPLTA